MKRLFFALTPVVLTNPLVALFLGDLVAGDKGPLNMLIAAAFAILMSVLLSSKGGSASRHEPAAGEILWGSATREWVIPSHLVLTTVPVVQPGTLHETGALVPIVDDGRVVGLAVWPHGVRKRSSD